MIQLDHGIYGSGVNVFASTQPAYARYSSNVWSYVYGRTSKEDYFVSSGWQDLNTSANGGSKNIMPYNLARYASNYDVLDSNGELFLSSSFTLSSGGDWSWTSWTTMSTALDITQYGDIVYETFDYPLSNPDDDPSVSPDPDTGTPDASNNGLFPWLRTQWVFLLQKLQDIVDAIQNLTFDLDPFPDQTKPILDDFFEYIFPDRVSSDDVSGIGNVLDKMSDWFDTGYGLSDLFGVFDVEGFDSWFSNETQESLDSVGSGE